MFRLAVLLLSILPADVRISRLDGMAVSGALESMNAETLTLAGSSGTESIPVADILSVEFSADAPVPPAGTPRLTLRDGSELSGSSPIRTARTIQMTSPVLGAVEVPASLAQALQLKSDNPAFQLQWESFRKRQTEKDLLIVTKRDGSGLDFLAGVVSSLNDEKADFLIDGETVPVPMARIYGIVFGATGNEDAVKSSIRVSLDTGDSLTGLKIQIQNGQLQLTSTWDQTVSIDVQRLRMIDMSAGRLTWLSDLTALETEFLGVDPDNSILSGLASPSQQQLLFGPRRDITMRGQSRLRLRGREFSKGLCIHSKTEMAWALDQKYASLECLVGIDDEVAFNGNHAVQLIVRGDDKILLDRLVSSTDEPFPVSIPLSDVSTLRITVDYGDADSICDWLDLADAKLLIRQD